MSTSIITSVVTGGSNSHQSVSEEFNAYATDFVNSGVLGTITLGSGSTAGTGAFAVTQDASPDMGVTVLLGVAYVACTPSGQDAQVLRARMTANYTSYTISANSSGSTKYDWIYLQASAANAATPSSTADNVITLYTSRSSSNSSDNGSPPTYGTLLAVVTVVNNATSITNSNISDRRTQASLSSVNSGGATGWTSLGYALTYSANNGNREFQVTTPNNLTGLLSAGMRLSIARSTTPPTQCMAFTAASSQYASKSSPSGISFTGNFTCETWIYLNSYTGSINGIIGRDSAGASGSGFEFGLTANGQPQLYWRNGSGATAFNAFQSLPLKKWVHVAAVATVATPTVTFYINGISVPGISTATSATSVVQASANLTMANRNSTAGYLDGYLSETRIWSTAQSSSNIQGNMAINLTGSESNLVSLFGGNGNFNDSTSNANNLTQSGGAIATQAANPYNATEYGIITAVSYSNPTTTITIFTPYGYTIPNQTLNTPYYSTARAPYGFPTARSKWRVDVLYIAVLALNTTSNTVNSGVTNGSAAIKAPIGDWLGKYFLYFESARGTTCQIYHTISLSTSNNSISDASWNTLLAGGNGSSATYLYSMHAMEQGISVSSDTTFYIVCNCQNSDAGASSAPAIAGWVTLECAHL